jgi:hypothetical protein
VRDSVQREKSDYFESDRSVPGVLGGSNVCEQPIDLTRRCRRLSGDHLMRTGSSSVEPNFATNPATSALVRKNIGIPQSSAGSGS